MENTMSKSYKWIATALAIVVIAPILMPLDSMWDNDTFAMYFFTGDKSYFAWILDHGWYIPYAIYDALGQLYQATGIIPRTIMGIMGAIGVLGLSRETYKYLQERFQFSSTAALFGAAGVLAYPLWHLLMNSHMAIMSLLFWLFMVAVNQRSKRPLLALAVLLPSLQLFSLFSFAIGFIAADFLMKVDRDNYRKEMRNSIIYCLLFLIGYLALTSIISVNGTKQTYNVIKPALAIWAIVEGAVASLVIFGATYFLHGRSLKSEEAQRTLRILLSFVALALFAGLAYWAVGRPMRFFSFGSFGSRHAMLMCIPFAVLLAFSAETLLARFGIKPFRYFAGFILIALVVLLYQGYSHKAAALLFKDMLGYSFQQIDEPKSGYVSIVQDGYKAPRHVHQHSVNMVMFKALGKSAWMANGFWARRNHEYSLEDIKQKYPEGFDKTRAISNDVTEYNFSKYKFSLDNYHQEGRVWYWYNYLFKDYDYFKPKMTLVEFQPEQK